MIRVEVLGSGQLADVTRKCCEPYHEVVDADPDVLWVCEDTPVAEDDTPLAGEIIDAVCDRIAAGLPGRTIVLVSSQVPVGTCAALEAVYPFRRFAVSPENIRIKHGVADFLSQRRIIIGARKRVPVLADLFKPFCDRLLWMSPESAELVKHALNGWLAMSIAYANDVASLVEKAGGDVDDVFAGFRSDARVSGPLEPGGPYRGGTLGRDIAVLCGLTDSPLIRGVRESNTRRL